MTLRAPSFLSGGLAAGLVIIVVVIAWLIVEEYSHHAHDHAHSHDQDHYATGPHGGRLLQEGDFALEITIFERGIPAEFRVYAYHRQRPLTPQALNLQIELTRLDGEVNLYDFTPQQDYLRGIGSVDEPHSFDVMVKAEYQQQNYQWQYASYEGRTEIPATYAEQAGIRTSSAGPALLHETASLRGRVQADPDGLMPIHARFPGVITGVQVNPGQRVRRGEVLVTVQSNESLQSYNLVAPKDALVVQRNMQPGMLTHSEPLLLLADTSRVMIELDVFSQDAARIEIGQSLTLHTLDQQQFRGVIEWISPLMNPATQSLSAHLRIANPDGTLYPGQFVRGVVEIAGHEVTLAVRHSAIQRFRDFQVVFARVGDSYEVRMLELGRADQDWVEVLSGLKPGTEYVTHNSYLIKADIEKSGASHDH